MRILIVTTGFFPGKKYGGPPVSIDNFCSLMDDCESYIITHNYDFREKACYEDIESGWNDRGNCKVLYLSDREYCEPVFEKYICEIKPDIIYLQSLFQKCVFSCLRIAKKNNIKVLLAPRGELCTGAFKKKFKKIPYIAILRMMGLLKNVFFQSTIDEETEAIKKYLNVDLNHIFLLNNLPSIPKQTFEYPEKKEGVAKFVYISRIHPHKNLIQAIRCLYKVKGTVIFDIYGPLEDENYWQICKKEMENLPDNVKVNYCGLITHDEVHKTFSNYNAFILPTLSENYGHAIIEALISGCPVIISNRTPWNDLEVARAGFVCELENVDEFKRAAQNIIDASDNSYRENAKIYAENRLNLNKIKGDYKRALNFITEA